MLVARRGLAVDGTRVVSDRWFDEVTRWGADEQQVLFANDASGQRHENGVGYKAFVWHCKPDGSQLRFVGHAGQQSVVCDIPSQTVAVQTAVSDEGGEGQQRLLAMLQLAIDGAMKEGTPPP